MAVNIPTGVWEIDPVHSNVMFNIRHMLAAKVRGIFNELKGTIVIADPIENSSVDVEIDATSIDTRNDTRDAHLKSADFLDVENYPTITFKSKSLELKSDTEGLLKGDLTIRGKTLPVDLHVELLDVATGREGKPVVGFSATTEINRDDFGVSWNAPLETGGLILGKNVKIEIDIEANKKD
jgi:polyisoprenoid-binding protein YceI